MEFGRKRGLNKGKDFGSCWGHLLNKRLHWQPKHQKDKGLKDLKWWIQHQQTWRIAKTRWCPFYFFLMNIKNEIIVYVRNVMIQKRLGAFSTTCVKCSKQLVENAPNLIIVIGEKTWSIHMMMTNKCHWFH